MKVYLLHFHRHVFSVQRCQYSSGEVPPINARLCCWAVFWRLFQIIQGCCLAPDWLSIHLEVVQKHSCAGSICNFLFVVSQTHYCASYPNYNHMGHNHSAAVEFSHWRKHTNSTAAAAASSLTTWAYPLLWWLPWISLFTAPVTVYGDRYGQLKSKPVLVYLVFIC